MNKLETLNYPIFSLPSGDQINLKIFRIQSENPGPHVHIQASVHGAEIQGNAVIYELMSYFLEHEFNGSITFIPQCNPQAMIQKNVTSTAGRFNSITGNNWNRNFVDISKEMDIAQFAKAYSDKTNEISAHFKKLLVETYERSLKELEDYGPNKDKKLNLVLQQLAATSDIVLDLHTGPIATRYLYCPEYQRESAKHFRFPCTLLIPAEFDGAMDEASFSPWVSLTKELHNLGIDYKNNFESYTVELGSEERISFNEAREDANRLLNYLHYKGVAKDFTPLPSQNQYGCLLKDYKTYYANSAGLTEFNVSPGEFYSEGTTLFKTLNFSKVKSSESLKQALLETKANNQGILINHCPSGVTHEGMEMVQVFENYFEL